MKNNKTKRIVFSALFAALSFVATLIVLPVPMSLGYVNLGDCMVLVCAYMAGGIYGAIGAGLGPALADITLSFPTYAPATFVIKACMAFVASLFFRTGKILFIAIGCVVAELIMVSGYFFFEFILYKGGALASVPGNLIQGGANALVAFVVITIISRNKTIRQHSFSK